MRASKELDLSRLNFPNTFFNHFVVEYGGEYYDPSYGGVATGLNSSSLEKAYEDKFIAEYRDSSGIWFTNDTTPTSSAEIVLN